MNTTELLNLEAASLAVSAATPDRRDEVIPLITRAFATDPVARWMYPDDDGFLDAYPRFVAGFGGAAFAHGGAFCTAGPTGAALWLPPGVHPDEPALMALMEQTLRPAQIAAVGAILEALNAHHPPEPHWHLTFLAVDPTLQGRGIGSALLQHWTEHLDRTGQTAYLESSHPRNVPLYRRHGFELTGEIQIGDAPRLFPMTRRPRTRGD